MTGVLVTGGAGFVGSHLVDALLAAGRRVRVLDSLLPQAHPAGVARFLSEEAELIVGDLRDRAAVDRSLDGVELVFHLGGIVGNGQSMIEPRLYTDINATGTATLLEAMLARKAQFSRLVVASSMVVYGDGAYRCADHGQISDVHRPAARLQRRQWEAVCRRCGQQVEPAPTPEDQPLRPNSVYGASKLAQEQLALVLGQAHRLPTVALRYLNIYGSRQALSNPYTGVLAIMTTRLLSGRAPLVFEDGLQQRDLVHVSDVVAATMAAARAGDAALYQAFNVGTGRSRTLIEMVRGLIGALGLAIEPEVTGQFRAGDIRHCYADVTRARELLGWSAKTSFDDGIRELVAWASHERPEDNTDRANNELKRLGILR